MNDILEAMRERALRDEDFRQALLATRKAADPLCALCDFASQNGYPLSLADVIAFGVLPAVIGIALLRTSPYLHGAGLFGSHWSAVALKIFLYAILMLYMLAALIRLAYFNVTEEERQKNEGGMRKYYTGLPVTSSSLIFPTVLLFRFIFLSFDIPIDISIVYVPVALVVGFLFLSKIKVTKPGMRGILFMIAIGLAECIALVLFLIFKGRHV